MKKGKLLIIVGGILLVLGVVLFTLKKEKPITYEVVEEKLSKEDAISLIKEKVNTIVDIYENKEKVFNTTSNSLEDTYLLVNNYDTVLKGIYTEKGISELETIKFGQDSFVKKEEDKVYLLKSIPQNNSYLNSTVSVEIKSNTLKEIEAVVSFSSDSTDANDILTYYVYEKNIKLIKNDDKWYVDTFVYTN